MKKCCFFVFVTLLVARTVTGSDTVAPALERDQKAVYSFEGRFHRYLEVISDRWLKGMRERNPAIVLNYRDRDQVPPRSFDFFAGEFAGKYLTGAVEIYRLTKDQELKQYLEGFVDEFLNYQASNGYFGLYPSDQGYKVSESWDIWGEYHVMLGLLFWYEETRDARALNAARRQADRFCSIYLGKPGELSALRYYYTNFAIAHSLQILYRHSTEQKYMDMARQILDVELQQSGDYMDLLLEGKEFYEIGLIHRESDWIHAARWEAQHILMALAEMYWSTGQEKYKNAFQKGWYSIVKTDRHNTGGVSTNEALIGKPYRPGGIEACATVGWTALTCEMLKLTGSSIAADELEITLLNTMYGYQPLQGGVINFGVPMDGMVTPFMAPAFWQHGDRTGGEELGCCTVNVSRGFGLVSEWAAMRDKEGITLNWYGASEITTMVDGVHVQFKQQTEYPRKGQILLSVNPQEAKQFALKLRVPYWSQRTTVKINGTAQEGVRAGTYLSMDRTWTSGDQVEINLDMSLHYWSGMEEMSGKTSVYRGPVLMCFLGVRNAAMPGFDATDMEPQLVEREGTADPLVRIKVKSSNGTTFLRDLDSATENNQPYITWLEISNAPVTEFSEQNPLRSGRVKASQKKP
ncbi:MAG: hypothetical protein CMJ62_12760 [Planctomycetaceae bacterium]|nr:hypothetical protein [Planctomycetaceae bacterium]